MDGPSFCWYKGDQPEVKKFVSVPQTITARNQDGSPGKKSQCHCCNRAERDDKREVADAENCITETVYQVEKRVEVRKLGPEWWQDGDRVKNAAEIDQGQNDKVGVHRQRIEVVCVDRSDNAELGKEEAGEASHGDRGKRVRPGQRGKKTGDQPDHKAYSQPAQHGGQGVSHDELGRGDWCDQKVDYAAKVARHEERGGHVGERVIDDAHQDQARDDKLGITETFEYADAFTEGCSEDKEIKRSGDYRGDQGLGCNA